MRSFNELEYRYISMARITAWIEAFALSIGGLGIFIIAFLDSSFLSFPEVNDLLIVLMVVRHPQRMLFYAAHGHAGLGRRLPRALLRRGARAAKRLLQKRFQAKSIEWAIGPDAKVRVTGACSCPALLPPPAPFKIFVLLAGVAAVPLRTFVLAIAVGRGVRYFGEGILAAHVGGRPP